MGTEVVRNKKHRFRLQIKFSSVAAIATWNTSRVGTCAAQSTASWVFGPHHSWHSVDLVEICNFWRAMANPSKSFILDDLIYPHSILLVRLDHGIYYLYQYSQSPKYSMLIEILPSVPKLRKQHYAYSLGHGWPPQYQVWHLRREQHRTSPLPILYSRTRHLRQWHLLY